jgi:hypothetical protein
VAEHLAPADCHQNLSHSALCRCVSAVAVPGSPPPTRSASRTFLRAALLRGRTQFTRNPGPRRPYVLQPLLLLSLRLTATSPFCYNNSRSEAV